MDLSAANIKQLANLLKDPDEKSDSSDDDLINAGIKRFGPGDIKKCTKMKVKVTANKEDNESNEEENEFEDDPKAIWQQYEVPIVPFSDDALSDPRMEPLYDIKYQQSIKTEDIYLQMANKTPASASCENMILTVHMKNELKNEIDCHITTKHLNIRSPKYRLSLPLPQPVDSTKCSTIWISEKEILQITLVLDREYDYINF